jgi:N-acetylmuramoyl-L-alanine amidase
MRLPLVARFAALAAAVALATLPASAQERTETLVLEDRATGATLEIPVFRPEGTAMIRADDLGVLGIRWVRTGVRWTGTWSDHEIAVEVDRPAVRVDGDGVQLTAAPRLVRGELFLPVQFLVDVAVDRMPGLVTAEESPLRVVLLPAGVWVDTADPSDAPPPVGPAAERVRPVVIIDPGHGGGDPGSIGPSGVREKDVALGVGRILATLLEASGEFEVHLTRDDDRLVPLWRRGPIATEIKGDRPGLFVSIHTNAVDNRQVRGFETYFLAEARTEDERRLAELENSAAQFGGGRGRDLSADPELGFILNELRNFDHQHWSADLAAVMQDELQEIHPGPNRGVKQGPLAVITNSIMPSVLVELGFISNPEEERLISSEPFQTQAAEALARAIRTFFEGYPPGASGA